MSYPKDVEDVFDEKRKQNSLAAFNRTKPALIRYGILAGAVLIAGLYCLCDSAKVTGIAVTGTRYLSSSYIEDVADVHTGDVYYAQMPFLLENSLESDPMIKDAKVSWSAGNVISIEVREKRPVGYRYEEEAMLLMEDGSQIPLSGDYLKTIADIPYITGFTEEEQTRLLCKALSSLSDDVISSIAEIHQYGLQYDDEAMKILMRTGGYYIGSYNSLDQLEYYDEIYTAQKDHSQCIWGFDSGSSASSQACPWNVQNSSVEYWTDGDGNVLKNTYGDAVVKHYYTKQDGTQATDANGNPIPIPVDQYGSETPDSDFQAHYDAGYYATGVLVLP